MKSENMFEARILFGQGKTATTIRTESGYNYPVIHEPYSHRAYYQGQARSRSTPPRRGDRYMHRSTLTIAKPPWSPAPGYLTTHKEYFSGSDTLEPPCRPSPCPSMHTSKIKFGTDEGTDRFLSDHMITYRQKDQILPSPPSLLSIRNKLNQTEGAKAKEVIKPEMGPQSYWSQYNRTHNFLGLLRGPGVGREYPVRQQYDVITGEEKGPAWKPDNARVSGNRVLHHFRQQLDFKPLLF